MPTTPGFRRGFGLIVLLASGILGAIGGSPSAATDPALERLRTAARGDPDAALDLAIRLDAGIEIPRDRDEALIWYVQAGMGGVGRAFVYLGQRYETGDGVPRNVALAREWYRAADAGLPAAPQRLDRLSVRAPSELARPQFVSSQFRGPDETVVLVWASPEQPAGTAYFLEVLEAGSLTVLHAAAHDLPAARLSNMNGAVPCCARIHAVAPDGARYLASDWLMLNDRDGGDPRAVPAPISLRILADAANRLAADLADDFRQSGIPVEVQPDARPAMHGVRFRYETDRGAASSVALMMPGPFVEPSLVPPEREADPLPRPGLIEVTLSARQARR